MTNYQCALCYQHRPITEFANNTSGGSIGRSQYCAKCLALVKGTGNTRKYKVRPEKEAKIPTELKLEGDDAIKPMSSDEKALVYDRLVAYPRF